MELQGVVGGKYDVDLVLCMDATSSMASHLDRTKAQAATFHSQLEEGLKALKGSEIGNLRVKIIVFRDLWEDKKDHLLESPFYSLPSDMESFIEFLDPIEAKGGGDLPESSLEPLALAMGSDWNSEGNNKKRHVIVLWTDDEAHPLERASKETPIDAYPTGRVPKSLNELQNWWIQEKMNPNAKRMVVMAPSVYPWNEIKDWEEVEFHAGKAAEGMNDKTWTEMITAMVKSIAS